MFSPFCPAVKHGRMESVYSWKLKHAPHPMYILHKTGDVEGIWGGGGGACQMMNYIRLHVLAIRLFCATKSYRNIFPSIFRILSSCLPPSLSPLPIFHPLSVYLFVSSHL